MPTIYETTSPSGLGACADGLMVRQLTDSQMVWAFPWPKRNLTARTELSVSFGLSKYMYGAWMQSALYNNQSVPKDQIAEDPSIYSRSFTYRVHGTDWNAATSVCVCANETEVNAAQTGVGVSTFISSWSKDENSGYGSLWVNGSKLTRTGGSALTTNSNRTNSTAADAVGIRQNAGAGMLAFFAWDRQLPDDEKRALFVDTPWQLFRPYVHRFYLDLGAGGGPSIPTLSLPGVQDVTQTTARPKVTLAV